jgi:hypothetical protein
VQCIEAAKEVRQVDLAVMVRRARHAKPDLSDVTKSKQLAPIGRLE